MRHSLLLAALPLVLAGTAMACPQAMRADRPAILLADNAATSTPAPAGGAAKAPDTAAFPNSPNGSPAAANKGQPVVTDRAACNGTGPAAGCEASPKPSGAADTSDTVRATPTTVDGTAPKP